MQIPIKNASVYILSLIAVLAVSVLVYANSGQQKRLIVPYDEKEVVFLYESKHNHIVRLNVHYFFEIKDREDLLVYSGQLSSNRCYPQNCGEINDETFYFTVKKIVNKEIEKRIYSMGSANIQGSDGFTRDYFSRTIHELYLTKGLYEITIRPERRSEKMSRFRKEYAVEWGPLMGALED